MTTTSRGTISNRSTSTRPRSVIFSDGITESARKASVRNGVAPVQPSPWAASFVARLCSITVASGASERRPATGRGHSATTRPSSTTTMPPPMWARWLTANARSLSLMPTTTRLCASCATDDASAPCVRPEPDDEAEPDPAGREVALDNGDLGEAGIGARDGVAVDDHRLALERLRHDLVLDQADRADRAAVRADLEIGGRDRLHPDGLAHPFRHGR